MLRGQTGVVVATCCWWVGRTGMVEGIAKSTLLVETFFLRSSIIDRGAGTSDCDTCLER